MRGALEAVLLWVLRQAQIICKAHPQRVPYDLLALAEGKAPDQSMKLFVEWHDAACATCTECPHIPPQIINISQELRFKAQSGEVGSTMEAHA